MCQNKLFVKYPKKEKKLLTEKFCHTSCDTLQISTKLKLKYRIQFDLGRNNATFEIILSTFINTFGNYRFIIVNITIIIIIR